MASDLSLTFTKKDVQILLCRLEDSELWKNCFLDRYINNQFHYPFKKFESTRQSLDSLTTSTNFTNFISSLDNILPISANQQPKRLELGLDRSLNVLNGLATIFQYAKSNQTTVSNFGSENVVRSDFVNELINCINRLMATQYLADDSLSKADSLFPKFCLQEAALETLRSVIKNVNEKKELAQLVVSLAGGITYFDEILLTKLLELIITTSLKILLPQDLNTINESAPEIPELTLGGVPSLRIDLDFNEEDSSELINDIIFPVLSGMSHRFKYLDEVSENSPLFLDWFELISTLQVQPTLNALKYVLSSESVNLNFIAELGFQFFPEYMGYPTITEAEATLSNKFSHHCAYVPYLFNSNTYVPCSKCQGKLDRCGIKCLCCLSSLHFGCYETSNSRSNLVNKILNNKTILQRKNCLVCNQPMLGTYQQAVQVGEAGKLYHLHCVTNEGGFSRTSSTEDLDSIINLIQSSSANIGDLERGVILNWIEINMVLEMRSHQDTEQSELVSKLRKLKGLLETNGQSLSELTDLISPLYCQSELHDIQASLDLTDASTSAQDLVNKLKHKLEFRTDLAAYAILLHMRLHGLVALVPHLNKPLSLPNLKVVPFLPLLSNQPQVDKTIDLRVLSNLVELDSLYANELGLLLATERLPNLSMLSESNQVHLIQPVLSWIVEIDIRLIRKTLKSAPTQKQGSSTETVNTITQSNEFAAYKATHAKLVRRYFLPWVRRGVADLGIRVFGQLLFNCLEILESSLLSIKAVSKGGFDGFKLDALNRLQNCGIPEDLWFILASRWVQSALVSYRSQTQHPDDLPNRIRTILASKVQGISFGDSGANLWFPVLGQSFLMINCLELLKPESPDLEYALGWIELLAMAHVKVPKFVENTPILLNHVSLDIALFNQYLLTLFYQLALQIFSIEEATQINLTLQTLFSSEHFQFMVKNASVELIERCALLTTVIGLLMTKRLYDQQTKELPKVQLQTSLASLPMHEMYLFFKLLLTAFSDPLLFVSEAVHHDSEVDSSHYNLEKGVATTLVQLAKQVPAKFTVVVLEALRILPPYARTHLFQDEDYIVWLWLLMVSSQQVYRPQPLDLLFEVGSSSPSRLLGGISPANILRFRGLEMDPLDGGWLWLDAAIGFLNKYTGTKSRQFPDGWKFVGPIFSAFVGFSMSEHEELRIKFEVLIRSLEKDVVNFLLLSWATHFDNCSLYDKIVTAKLMLHLATLIPKMPVLPWRSIVGHLTLFQNDPELNQLSSIAATNNRSQPYQPKVQVAPMVLKVSVISLAFTLMANKVPIQVRDVATIKFLLARTLGIADAQLDAGSDGGYRVHLPTSVTFNLQDPELLLLLQTFLSKFKVVLDSLATVEVPVTDPNLAPDDSFGLNSLAEKLEGNLPVDDAASALEQSIGSHFVDLLFKVLASALLAPTHHLTEPFLAEVVECLQILVYKYDMDNSVYFHSLLPLIQRLSRMVGSSKDLNGVDLFSESLGLAILNLFHTILAKAPQLSHHILSAQVLAMVQLASKLVEVEDDSVEVDLLALKAKAFLTTAFRTYATNGLFILTFKNYDYDKYGDTLFQTLAMVLNESVSSRTKLSSSVVEFNALEQPIVDVLNRLLTLPVSESLHFNRVVCNLARYIIYVHNANFSERLFSELFVTFTPRFVKHISEWLPSQFDATPLYLMLAQIVYNHPNVSELFIQELKNLLKVTVGRFSFQPPALSLLLEAVALCFEDSNSGVGKEGTLDFGSIISEEFSSALSRTKPKVSSSHLIALVSTITYTKPTENYLDNSLESRAYLMSLLEGKEVVEPIEEVLDLVRHPPLIYFTFQEFPVSLIPNLISYLNHPHHFTKRHPNSFTTGVYLSYLLVHLLVSNRRDSLDWAQLDVYSNEPRKGALAWSWLLVGLLCRSQLDFLSLANQLQPVILKVIRDSVTFPIQGELSSTMVSNLSDEASIHSNSNFRFPGQLLCLGMTLIKLWVSVLYRCEEVPALPLSPPPLNTIVLDLEDPYLPTNLKSTFWFSLWPILLGILVPGLALDSHEKELPLGYKDLGGRGSVATAITANAVAELILHLASLRQLDTIPGLLLPEVTAFFRDFATLEPQLCGEVKFRMARGVLNGDVLPIPYDQFDLCLLGLMKELASLVAP